MTRRKGELSANRIDREWSHQVTVLTDRIMGKKHDIIHEFCRGLSVCPHVHTVRRDEYHVQRHMFRRRAAR
jgi:hypothetical protein